MNHNFLFRGLACIAIGAAVLLAPHLLGATGLRDTVAASALVGWFALALGVVLVVLHLARRRIRR